MADVARRFRSVANSGAVYGDYSTEDPGNVGINTKLGESKGNNNIKVESPRFTSMAMKQKVDMKGSETIDYDVTPNVLNRAKNNAKKYNTTIYLGKEGNEDLYLGNVGKEGIQRYTFSEKDSAESENKRSTITDYSKSTGLSNAIMQAKEEGINLDAKIMKSDDKEARMGGDIVTVQVSPISGTMTNDERKKLIEILTKNGVISEAVQEYKSADLMKEPNAKHMFSKQAYLEPSEANEMMMGVDGDKLALPPRVKEEKQGMSKMNVKDYANVDENGNVVMKDREKGPHSPFGKMLTDGEIENDKGAKALEKMNAMGDKKEEKYEFKRKDGRIKVTDKETGKDEIDLKDNDPDKNYDVIENIKNPRKINKNEKVRSDKSDKKVVDTKGAALVEDEASGSKTTKSKKTKRKK
jgi:hypothetical protein